MQIDLSCWVVKRNKQYLVAIHEDQKRQLYSPYSFDAAQIESANDARRVADRVGGNIHRFNPLTGEVV